MVEQRDLRGDGRSQARTTTWTVLIVDDHDIVRWGLSQLFEREPGFSVCGTAGDASEAVKLVEAHAPHLTITDISLPGRSGLELIKQIHALHPAGAVLAMSMHDKQLYARRALAAGALGYVSKGDAREDIVGAACAVLAGRTYVAGSDRPGVPVHDAGADVDDADQSLSSLTDRELEVFLLIGDAYAPRHIAETLSLSTSTIEVYRQRLKKKLGLQSALQLRRYATHWRHNHIHEPAAARAASGNRL